MPRPRPAVHLTARSGWINDPLGVTWWDGRYHCFFQHVPDDVRWRADISWGHAVSADLVHWEEQPVALAPGEGDGGVWSGCLVTDGDVATILYTAVDAAAPDLGRVRAAHPLDRDWRRWQKGAVVLDPAADAPVHVVRDPFVVREEDGWRMLLGAALPGEVAAVLTYRSDDLRAWRFDGVLAERPASETDPVATGELWECPQLVRFGETAVLVVSVWNAPGPDSVAYAVGTLEGGRFRARTWRRLTWAAPYAPTVFLDAQGAPCILFWLRDVDGDGWAGALSVPYRLELEDDRMRLRPHPELDVGMRTQPVPPPGDPRPVGDRPVRFRWDGSAGASVDLLGAGGRLAVRLDAVGDAVRVSTPGGAPVSLPHEGPPIELLLDGSVLEVVTAAGLLALPLPPVAAVVAGAGRRDVL